jgi:cell division protein FtsI (penicillin-binding protein 3)
MPNQLQAANLKPAASQPQQLAPQPFRPGGELTDPLPPGAHRVISTIAAAEMRKMMEGVVLYGTGKPAQLNGYSSGGKTGTAQKVDPVTHLYSKTMHVASFAGIAPVNEPVIAVAVVIDTPHKGPSYYGTAVSAPVFAEVAQQVLEYLGVPHDEPIRSRNPAADHEKPATEDDHGNEGDVDALYAAVNDLPPDDPLKPQTPAQPAKPETAPQKPAPASAAPAVASAQPAPTPQPTPRQSPATVVMTAEPLVRVPSFLGLSMRKVIEEAAGSGLEVAVTGSGTVRQQAPAPGTMVAQGTRVVVSGAR